MLKIQRWNPENNQFWQATGRRIALRNLFWSILTLIVAFMVWISWSAVAVQLNEIRPDFSVSQLYWLTAIPLLSAAFLRLLYSFMIPIWGGRNWTVFSTFILLIPMLGMYLCLSYQASFTYFLLTAILTGLGGANFASSSSNISLFFPYRLKSIALGINAALGNLGVGLIQLLVPYLVAFYISGSINTSSHSLHSNTLMALKTTPIVLIAFIIIASIGAYFYMDNPQAPKTSLKDQLAVLKDRHCWIVSILYTFTFGTFIGFSTLFPLLISTQFQNIELAQLAFSGVIFSSLMRPVGHFLAGSIGAVRLTVLVFILIPLGFIFLLVNLPSENDPGNFQAFMIASFILFLGTGLGKGSTTSLIPEIYSVSALKKATSQEERNQLLHNEASHKTAVVLGWSSAIATFGAFLIPITFDLSQRWTASVNSAIYLLFILNILCLFITAWFYLREHDSNPLCVTTKTNRRIVIDRPALMRVHLNHG